MPIDLAAVKNIIFDLGNVLLNLDFNASIEAFRKLGLADEVVDSGQAYSDPVFYELETGQVSAEGFRERIREILNNPEIPDEQIDDAWCAMVLDIPAERVEVVKKLREKFNIYLFSNTNEIHINRLHAEFKNDHGIDFPSLFVNDFYSHEIGERKPDLSAYQKVIRLSGVQPEETLFVDDLENNIDAAHEAGLKTFWLKKGMEMTKVFNGSL
ncbi:putative hydrolase of the HAD superfamily [Tangfeifania diversioriginum]|uniref:Putative hydrolase of the HAD superfamily n=1 Tax=Tangfeifania diversioriginum TaxID=1168035 RepID=A0A1M6LT38_9BACT|nr:HAD family phosphatase [Tangfeifania diversioriginum]SHJ74340.1 putative hydrolase of the HAD superfamily [Tangfeifania diversioriginum]